MNWKLLSLGAILSSAPFAASVSVAQEREDWIPVQVSPYYTAGDTREDRPQVAIGNVYSPMLASNRLEDILQARDVIAADPSVITPMTLFVLAIRLYDLGERDEAVFWYYAGKNRAITLVDTLSFAPGFDAGGVRDAIGAFIQLAGPYFNSYAFCDFQKQQAVSLRAIDWVEAHPYETIFADNLRSRRKAGDINANLAASIKSIRDGRDREIVMMNDPTQLAEWRKQRDEQQTDAKFCWSS